MKTKEELLRSRGYWIANIQLELFKYVDEYMRVNNLNRTQLAEKLGVTKGYISQVLNGEFNHRIATFVDLALAIGKAPKIEFEDLELMVSNEHQEFPGEAIPSKKLKSSKPEIKKKKRIKQIKIIL